MKTDVVVASRYTSPGWNLYLFHTQIIENTPKIVKVAGFAVSPALLVVESSLPTKK